MLSSGSSLLQLILNILQLAAFYAPLAVAFALIQALTKRVFLSFGDFAMFGSIAAIYMCFGRLLYGASDLEAALLALFTGIACAASLGLVSARWIFVPLMKASSLAFMIAALGFSIAIQELMRITTNNRDIWVPPLFQGQVFQIGGGDFPVNLTVNRGLAFVISFVALGCLYALLKFTSFGRNWRACAQNQQLAALCGINVERVAQLTFILGTGLSAVSGWMSAVTYGGTNFSLGIMLGFKAMFAAVAGGFGSIRGAIIGAFSLAALEVSWSTYFNDSYRDVGVFSFIILVLLLKPEGLGSKLNNQEREA